MSLQLLTIIDKFDKYNTSSPPRIIVRTAAHRGCARDTKRASPIRPPNPPPGTGTGATKKNTMTRTFSVQHTTLLPQRYHSRFLCSFCSFFFSSSSETGYTTPGPSSIDLPRGHGLLRKKIGLITGGSPVRQGSDTEDGRGGRPDTHTPDAKQQHRAPRDMHTAPLISPSRV